jgi:AcrR family transcriptional regulator
MYIHYPTKEDLLLQLCLDGYREIDEIVCAAESRGTNPGDRLGEWVQEFVMWHVRFQVRARVIHFEVEALSSLKLEEVKVSGQLLASRLRRIIADGVEWGRFRVPDAYLTAAAILSMGIDVARWYKVGGAWSAEEVGERYRYLALRMVGYAPPAPPRP